MELRQPRATLTNTLIAKAARESFAASLDQADLSADGRFRALPVRGKNAHEDIG